MKPDSCPRWVDGHPSPAASLRRPHPPTGCGPPGTGTGTESELNINFEALASSEAAGCATPDEIEVLRAHPVEWVATLRQLLADTEEGLVSARRITGDEREMVLADLADERDRLRDALVRLGAEAPPRRDRERDRPERRNGAPAPEPPPLPYAPPALQASWHDGRVVLWAGSHSVPAADKEELDRLLTAAGAGTTEWEAHSGVSVPGGGQAAAVSAPIAGALGWLVGVGAGHLAADAAPSLRWIGGVAAWATELVAQGRMVPSLVGPEGSARAGRHAATEHVVRWVPAAVDRERLRRLASRMPGAVAVLEPSGQPERLCRSLLGACVHAISRVGAGRLVTAATVPVARSRSEISEAVLAGMAGAPFMAGIRAASEMSDELDRWVAPVVADGGVGLTVTLHAPEDDGGWLLAVDATGVERQPVPVERALAGGVRTRTQVETQLRRLERLVPALRRPASHRGKVMLDGGEAWELMTRTGRVLAAAGFGVRLPVLSPRRPTTRLHLHADPSGPALVGAQQLSQVRWSVLVDDVELDAGDIARLAAQARPLLRVGGGWVEVDKADLEAAAEALAERAATTQLSGAAILRHAVGLEGGRLSAGTVVDGAGWAVDLLRGATAAATQPLGAPAGFKGELRHYQAEARGWLDFLDRAGLGGCLAMDMGLGKTPTVLAHVLASRSGTAGGDGSEPGRLAGPVLVIAPPAVLGNWAAEAERFTPELRVHVHHGGDRAEDIAGVAYDADVVLTTYGTAVRDVEALAGVDWARIVIDEAQAIKNPASDTAQQLRRIPARSRLALTGTPIENGLGDLWSILDFTNPGLVGPRTAFVEALSRSNGSGGEEALRALNGLLVFRRTKAEPEIAAELPDKIDELDHCAMTPEQVGLYQAVLDRLLAQGLGEEDATARKGHVLAAITALKQICDHPAAYLGDDDSRPLDGRSGKLARLDELVDAVFSAGERMLVFTHFARWGERLAEHLTQRTGIPVACYHGGLTRTARDRLIREFQEGTGPGALVLSIKAGGSGLNLTSASHVVLYDRWWNPAVEDQARDRAWRIGQANTVVCHRLVCPGTVDERVEEVVAGKRRIADLVLPASSSLGDLNADQLRAALGLRSDAIVEEVEGPGLSEASSPNDAEAAA